MSDQETKISRSKRFSKSKNRGLKRYKDALIAPLTDGLKYTRRFEDRSYFTCGNSNCIMCGNPRKFFDLKTLKEQSDEQIISSEMLPRRGFHDE